MYLNVKYNESEIICSHSTIGTIEIEEKQDIYTHFMLSFIEL
jgi:hypothetical protein